MIYAITRNKSVLPCVPQHYHTDNCLECYLRNRTAYRGIHHDMVNESNALTSTSPDFGKLMLYDLKLRAGEIV